MSNVEQMLDTIDAKLKTLVAPFLLDTDNVISGETYNKLWKPDSEFPRYEYVYEGEDNFTYYSQNTINPVDVFMITGFFRVTDFDQNLDRQKFIALTARTVLAKMFEMNVDKRMGISTITGFLRIHEIFHIDSFQEVQPRVDSFKCKFGIDSTRNWALS